MPILAIEIEDQDGNWDKVMAYLTKGRQSFSVEYWYSFVPPNRFGIKMGPLTPIGVERSVQRFRELEIPFRWKTYESTEN